MVMIDKTSKKELEELLEEAKEELQNLDWYEYSKRRTLESRIKKLKEELKKNPL